MTTGRNRTAENTEEIKVTLSGDNEASVRAEIVDPILRNLGFSDENILRDKTYHMRVGSTKKTIDLRPDYLLKVENGFALALDAKAPKENVFDRDHVLQVYSYAVHPEIRSKYFALCNGIEFACYRTADFSISATDMEKPELHFHIREIDKYWPELQKTLSPNSFQTRKTTAYDEPKPANPQVFDYLNRPLLGEVPVRKQAAKRHFGVNSYFTRQAWDVVAEYIKNFSKEGDTVLDPFGGSGVTAIEALMNNRKAISVDINPLSVFIMQSLIAAVSLQELRDAYDKVCDEYKKKELKDEIDIENALKKYPLPKNLSLPKNSDVETVFELFSKKQMAELALLKSIIKKQKNKQIISTLSLVFYNTISVINKTFHETPKGGGNHFGYYYRYRIAPRPANKNIMQVFDNKFKRIYAGKQEMERYCNNRTLADLMNDAQIMKGSATDLNFLKNESVDYIYTDPPYGKKIPYLDLSIMWNAWLDLDVSEEDYLLEAIEGGEHNKTKVDYCRLISQSIQEMYRVLKFDRWLSFVFAHKDPEFWHLIVETCEKCGFEYVGVVSQKNGQTSFKKRQNPFTVLSGELIINFRKVRSPKAILKANLGMNIGEIVLQTVEGIIAKHEGATLEQINNEIVTKGLELGFLDLLKKEYNDLEPILRDFDFDHATEKYRLKKNAKFKTHVDEKLRIKYYLLSFLRRMERENKLAHTDEIILTIMPLLRNGITPEEQTILGVLNDIAERVGTDSWRLKKDNPQLSLFGPEF